MAHELLQKRSGGYLGLRMSADEFLTLPEDRRRYELVDGVVVMSPSPAFWHQAIVMEIGTQIHSFLQKNPIGAVVPDVDVKLGPSKVYRPDIIYLCKEKAALVTERITTVIPDVLVEIISPSSRNYDRQTKREDYESAGVGEYWLIDAKRNLFTFLVLKDGCYQEASFADNRYRASVIRGFELNIERVRAHF